VSTTMVGLARATAFLAAHPDVVKHAYVVVHADGHWEIQLARHTGDDETRVGILYGIAAVYSGEVSRHDMGKDTVHVTVEARWRHDQTVNIFTAVNAAAAVAS